MVGAGQRALVTRAIGNSLLLGAPALPALVAERLIFQTQRQALRQVSGLAKAKCDFQNIPVDYKNCRTGQEILTWIVAISLNGSRKSEVETLSSGVLESSRAPQRLRAHIGEVREGFLEEERQHISCPIRLLELSQTIEILLLLSFTPGLIQSFDATQKNPSVK